MIDQLDQILKKILDDKAAPQELREAEVSFDIPKESYKPAGDTTNLYLYDIHENRNLRDLVPIYKMVNGKYTKLRPPLRVDCAYMLTAWSTQSGDKVSAHEHKLLSQALMWLSQFPEIPGNFLPEDWKDNTNAVYQPFPVYLAVAQSDGVKAPGEFWAALGSPPRPYLNMVVTIAMDLPKSISESIPKVITKTTEYEQLNTPGPGEEEIQIGGRVTNMADPPVGIEGALVTILELKKTTRTDKDGYYSLANLPRGQFTFMVRASGYEEKQVMMRIPIDEAGKNYDIQLS